MSFRISTAIPHPTPAWNFSIHPYFMYKLIGDPNFMLYLNFTLIYCYKLWLMLIELVYNIKSVLGGYAVYLHMNNISLFLISSGHHHDYKKLYCAFLVKCMYTWYICECIYAWVYTSILRHSSVVYYLGQLSLV